MSGVNVPLLRKAVEWAEAEAAKPLGTRHWYQGAYLTHDGELVDDDIGEATQCGTAFCIAGFVGQTLDARYAESDRVNGTHVGDFAAKALGIDPEEAEDGLFDGGNTITDVRRIAESLAGERL